MFNNNNNGGFILNIFSPENIQTVTAFANEEYLNFARKMFTDFNENQIYIGLPKNNEVKLDEWNDEIYINVKSGNGIITGSNPGSVVIAMYRFLKECGCRFIRPGKNGDYIPETTLNDKIVFVNEKATSEKRCMIIEGSCSIENVYNMIEFCPKIALNTYEFQFLHSTFFFDRWYTHPKNPLREDEKISHEFLEAEEAKLKKEVIRRGMKLQTMGHGFTAYPVGLFPNGWSTVSEEQTEKARPYLALYQGKRDLVKGQPFLSNLCYSQPQVQEKMADYMVQYCKENPDVSTVTFALADNINTTCECENCRTHRISDFAIKILNKTDEEMTKAGLTQLVNVMVYQDTFWAPREEKLNNPKRFQLGFYPISHFYDKPLPIENIPDEEPRPYEVNKQAISMLPIKQLAHLKDWQKSAVGCKWFISEYHFMWNHYSDIGYQKISKILYDDIKNQNKLGLNGLSMYQPQRCACPTAMGLHVMGNTLWNKNIEFGEICEEYFKYAYGNNWEQVLEYLQTLSDTYDTLLIPGSRDYRVVECIPTFEKCIEMVKNFDAKSDAIKDESSLLTKTSWSDLKLHNKYVVDYLNAVIVGLNGDKDKGEVLINELCNWLWSIEPEVQERWDIALTIRLIPEWYMRLMFKKSDQEKNVKTCDLAKAAGNEGIQG